VCSGSDQKPLCLPFTPTRQNEEAIPACIPQIQPWGDRQYRQVIGERSQGSSCRLAGAGSLYELKRPGAHGRAHGSIESAIVRPWIRRILAMVSDRVL
jgi:hypothetical protein